MVTPCCPQYLDIKYFSQKFINYEFYSLKVDLNAEFEIILRSGSSKSRKTTNEATEDILVKMRNWR